MKNPPPVSLPTTLQLPPLSSWRPSARFTIPRPPRTAKVDCLKALAKSLQLKVSGRKQELWDRIDRYYITRDCAVIIQAYFRRYLIRLLTHLRGPATVKMCVNETDFYTLEPLQDIDYCAFFSVRDSQCFDYGFNLFSLIQYYRTTGKLINPYTRAPFTEEQVQALFSLYTKTRFIFPHLVTEHETAQDPRERSGRISSNPHLIGVVQQVPRHASELLIPDPTLLPLACTIQIKLNRLRRMSLHTRIQELFMEIELLGNYVQSRWFSDLDHTHLCVFLVNLRNHWYYHGNIRLNCKRRISFLRDPFNETDWDVNAANYTFEQIQELCIHVMEYLVYGGINDDFRTLGSMHVLTILSLVSPDARNALEWTLDML